MLSTLGSISNAVHGQLQGDGNQTVTGISIDTRTLESGELFFALRGERDGHQFLEAAQYRGAAGAVVNIYQENLSLPQIVVKDSLQALQSLAQKKLAMLKVHVVAVTGSNGKTTTKDIIASVLGTKYRTLKTQGNFNNEIGLPLTLLQLDERYQAAVVEMAMRGRDQIRRLTEIAPPNVGVITNISSTHMELLGSMKNIAAAKGELLEGLASGGTAILNGDDHRCRDLGRNFKGKKIYFGLNEGNELRAVNIKQQGWRTYFSVPALGAGEFHLPLPGLHNIRNAMSALAVASSMNIPVPLMQEGLENVSLSSMRLETLRGVDSSLIINDAYNANPASTMASLQILKEFARKRSIAVLGDMFELGEYSEEGHREVGRKTVELGIDYLFTVGNMAESIGKEAIKQGMETDRVYHFPKREEALTAVQSIIRKGDTVLVKGSRGMQMESIAQGLTARD
ncbi:UDP-N-acetylmuramoyl-tripeptide--D-alanyl-D-alanine ligase [Metallumcola ferriviriculae]|uniref:UDP-N-acetylmuramoyl-tripeptide--D-alanyl-D-alanine ligase n=1 Tax=Metallumcola ferriviriculae TaxID=3039180 RepID=A0AAU0UP80_9FIRM|nr:UDP-N-acetylmuramoyl-tripeptide--D-alanyl-D-alanine ligase [Desulfitibacteraceae bacterium MK1]